MTKTDKPQAHYHCWTAVVVRQTCIHENRETDSLCTGCALRCEDAQRDLTKEPSRD